MGRRELAGQARRFARDKLPLSKEPADQTVAVVSGAPHRRSIVPLAAFGDRMVMATMVAGVLRSAGCRRGDAIGGRMAGGIARQQVQALPHQGHACKEAQSEPASEAHGRS
jgi:hypothetical protein